MRNTSRSLYVGACPSSVPCTLFPLSFLLLLAGFGCNGGGDVVVGGSGGKVSHNGGGGGKGGNGGPGGTAGGFTLPPTPDASPDRPGGGLCGDGIIELAESCDDGNTNSEDGCSVSCQIEANWECPEEGKACVNMAVCGNRKLTSNETCDDGNTDDGDGCSKDCQTVTEGWICPVPGKKCIPECGDGKIIKPETCDDGNAKGGDGCSVTCQTESGYDCKEEGKACIKSQCGNGKEEKGELCDCGTDAKNLPGNCKAVNGLFYGDATGCSKTCTKEPTCIDSSSGKTRACDAICGDGNVDPNEECDDGNQADGDGCSTKCKKEEGFSCESKTSEDSADCQSGGGKCLQLPIIYRDFQPENVTSGGHPDFYFLGTKYSSTKSTTICVPNSGGPAKGNDSTARCWGIMADTLLKGKPQPGSTKTCACQFSDWNIANSDRIPGKYTEAGNDSPFNDGAGHFQGGTKGTAVNTTSTTGPYTGTLVDYTASAVGGPIWKGTTPTYKDATSFKQWYNDDKAVNTTFTDVLEMKQIGTNIYQYASTSHLGEGGFFPLDTLNSSQKTLCNLWPYWNHGDGKPIWSTCSGDQYLFPPRATASDCATDDTLDDGCWVTAVKGMTHDSYFTDEARYYFAYDGATGISLQFYGDDDLFIFINGNLVLDLGGVHQQLPGKVTVINSPGDATVVEGGCLDAAGNIIGTTAGSADCSPKNGKPPTAATPDDFRTRTVKLGLETGKVYEIAIFGADRHPPESNYQLTLQGFSTKQSACAPRCGDGVATNGEQCDCGDEAGKQPEGCSGPNNDDTYGGCKKDCTYGPFCGDNKVQTENGGSEECDLGKDNGNTDKGRDGCTLGCMKPHFCGDEIVDPGEKCDLGDRNDKKLDKDKKPSDADDAIVYCKSDCSIPGGVVF